MVASRPKGRMEMYFESIGFLLLPVTNKQTNKMLFIDNILLKPGDEENLAAFICHHKPVHKNPF